MLTSPVRLLLLVLGAFVLAPASALAAPASVSVVDDAFTPANVAIAPGETVTWTWDAGGHNVRVTEGPVKFDSGFKSAGATFTRALTEGTYRYVCDAHSEMRGVVTVGSGTAPAPAPAPAPSAAAVAAPRTSAVSVRRHGVLRLRSSAAGQVRARILRGRRVVRRMTLQVAAGANRIALDVRGLRLGRHRLVVGAGRTRKVRRFVVTARARRRPATAPAPSPAPAPATAPAPAPAPAPADDDGTPDRGGDDDD